MEGVQKPAQCAHSCHNHGVGPDSSCSVCKCKPGGYPRLRRVDGGSRVCLGQGASLAVPSLREIIRAARAAFARGNSALARNLTEVLRQLRIARIRYRSGRPFKSRIRGAAKPLKTKTPGPQPRPFFAVILRGPRCCRRREVFEFGCRTLRFQGCGCCLSAFALFCHPEESASSADDVRISRRALRGGGLAPPKSVPQMKMPATRAGRIVLKKIGLSRKSILKCAVSLRPKMKKPATLGGLDPARRLLKTLQIAWKHAKKRLKTKTPADRRALTLVFR